MNSRGFTNIVRYFMDEWLPLAIRDSKFFMFSFYYYAYNEEGIKTVMNLKPIIFKWSEKEFSDFYSNRDTRFSNSRLTDMFKQCVKYVFEQEMKMKFYSCEKIHGDLIFIGDMEKEKKVDHS
ncbi:hypothetical protein [uncultured Aquimarina sp.]|uniref:hypothetical protein n=1 Tax=uncultured Aquimarina sp. TaxID=575652 RepID=UPI0026198346|nr:hypothetical protein [uncultured Aquimarina sp.]